MTPRACRRHRPVLVDLVDRGERGPGTPAALDHLAVCGACEGEVTELALTIAALRRAGVAYRALPVPPASRSSGVARGGPVVRPARRGGPWAWRLQLGGLVMSAGLAALVLVPWIGLTPGPRDDAEPAQGRPAAVVTWRTAERRLATSPDVAPVAALGSLPHRYPDGLIRPWKEVPKGDAAAHELEPS